MLPTTFKEFIIPCTNKNTCLGDLLFIHGFCVEHGYFTASRELAKYFNVYMIDLPGHGSNTEGVTPEDLKTKKLADYIVSYIEFKKLNNFYLMGHSMGGALVSIVANIIPNKIKKLFLLCPANPAAMHAGLKNLYIFYPRNMKQKNRLLKCLYAPENLSKFLQNPLWVELSKKQLEFQLAN
jgi:pimeloyl-ACP methyl ester carboxylesterase